MKLLVVTPTLGSSRWLKDTVESVERFAPGSRQILVAPREKMEALRKEFPAVEVVPERGGGMYAAINDGVAAAGGAWDAFTYLNDDDVLGPNFAAATRLMSATTGEGIVYGRVALIGAGGESLGALSISPVPNLNRELWEQRIEPLFQQGTLVNRAAWNRLAGFDETLRFCGDSEFLARACVKGVQFQRAAGGPVAAFRLRAGQLTKNRTAMEAERKKVDEKLGLRAKRKQGRHLLALMIFRVWNLPVYAGRVRRFGFVSFNEAMRRVE